MAGLKTRKTAASVETFLAGIGDRDRREDCRTVLALMQAATKAEPRMWGAAIVGLGDSHYKYESGREGDWFRIGFSPRAQNLTLYLPGGFEKHKDLMKKLGKHKTGKSCLYIGRLSDVDLPTLEKLIKAALAA